MRCPRCGCIEDKVIDSRAGKDGASIRRRRVCLGCGLRFTTYESIERVDLRIIKRDGRTETFDRQKVLSSFAKACEKRPISREQIERLVDDIQLSLETWRGDDIPSQEVGLRVMERLRALDPVAYVRYASVYREFQEVGDFLEEIQTLERSVLSAADHPELFVSPLIPKSPATS
jgi:transcriptional repressor NrdR